MPLGAPVDDVPESFSDSFRRLFALAEPVLLAEGDRIEVKPPSDLPASFPRSIFSDFTIVDSRPECPPVDGLRRYNITTSIRKPMLTLKGASPSRISEDLGSEFFLRSLYGVGDWLCVASDKVRTKTQPRDECLPLGSRLIVASPMIAKFGITNGWRVSQHTHLNTGRRRYFVTEFSEGSANSQAALILYLRQKAPLTMVVSSGKRSLQAWWNVAEMGERGLRDLYTTAVTLGANPATWTRSRFVCLPQARRPETGSTQTVLYFDPAKVSPNM